MTMKALVYQSQLEIRMLNLWKNLVWSGFGSSGPGMAHGIHVCNYKNADHLCFFQGRQMVGYARGHGVIMNKHYQIVQSIEPVGSSVSADLHEFNLLPNGKSALMTIYHPRAYDLTAYGIVNGLGYIQDSVFQEVDVDTGELIFEWRSLDHIDPTEGYVDPASTEISGDGMKDTPWDYFHINSIDKNTDGDYLISARHVSCIYKISGKDGHVIWRLHGAKSDFDLENFGFSSQHDARWHFENSTHTILSLFDNASNGYNQTEAFSTSMIVQIDHNKRTARLLQDYTAPHNKGGLLSKSQGNTQVLPDGHVITGWGSHAYLTEHLANGTCVFFGWTAITGTMVYRVYKANWTADPLTAPNIWSFSKSRKSTVFYASWNGATKVTHWKFYTSNTRSGPWQLASTVKKTGFETSYKHDAYTEWTYVEALHNDKVLRRSSVEKTFVPGPELSPLCHDYACQLAIAPSEEERRKQEEEAEAARLAAEEAETAEKEAQARIEEEEHRKAAARLRLNIIAGLLVVIIFVLVSRKNVRRTLLLWFSALGSCAAEAQQRSLNKLQLWKGRYSKVGSG